MKGPITCAQVLKKNKGSGVMCCSECHIREEDQHRLYRPIREKDGVRFEVCHPVLMALVEGRVKWRSR